MKKTNIPEEKIKKIRKEFCEKKISLSRLAREYEIDYQVLYAISRKEGWKDAREEIIQKNTKKIVEATAETRADKMIKITQAAESVADTLLQMAQQAAEGITCDKASVEIMERLAKAIRTNQQTLMQSYGLATADTESRIQADKDKAETAAGEDTDLRVTFAMMEAPDGVPVVMDEHQISEYAG